MASNPPRVGPIVKANEANLLYIAENAGNQNVANSAKDSSKELLNLVAKFKV